MLYDRRYLGASPGAHRWWHTATVVLLLANLAVYAFQRINDVYLQWPVDRYLALHTAGLAKGWLWQLLTFQFLHADNWHFLLNAVVLFFLGRSVEESVGRGRFLEVYFLSGVCGGLLQTALGLLLPRHFGHAVMGASAGIFGLIAVLSLLDPDRLFLFWFVLPIKAKYFLIASLAISLFFVLVPGDSRVAHGAHLGGILGGMAYVFWFIRPERRLFHWRRYHQVLRPRQLVNATAAKRPFWTRPQAEPLEELPPEEFISREVDPILDKISAHGLHSLTPRERQILERARQRMGQR